MAQNTFLGPGKLKICFCGCVNTCSYCLAATVQMRLLPSFSISVSRLLMADSATPDFGDPSNQQVHVYSVPPSAAIFPSSLACSLRDVSDSTVQKEQLGLCVLPEVSSQEPPILPIPSQLHLVTEKVLHLL